MVLETVVNKTVFQDLVAKEMERALSLGMRGMTIMIPNDAVLPQANKTAKKPPVAKRAPALKKLEASIGYVFQSKSSLRRALTHRSAQQNGKKFDYEQLEFIGDAVLDLAIAHILLNAYPTAKEGDLSKMRSALVNTQSLARLAREIDISPFIVLSRAEVANGAAERDSILEDVLEAILGAIYREAGFDQVLGVIEKHFSPKIGSITVVDAKTDLQELLHVLEKGSPEYRLEGTEGPEHAPLFLSSVLIEGKPFGPGKGQTKKASQQDAARIALEELRLMSKKEKSKTLSSLHTKKDSHEHAQE